MPVFRTLPPIEPPPPPGIYVAKVVKAVQRTSEHGNEMLVMRLELADGRTLPSILTFVEAAKPVINAFCQSAGLIIPPEPDVEVDLKAEHVRGRHIYFRLEHDADGAPKITRFIDRQAALAANPRLAEVTLAPQAPVTLPVIKNNGGW